ncbi:P63C domain-containing protein [Leisingera aquaemixtae]|uniref:P63C domain-containing protein n=1 Tax=Leisingera aquaemixtae TaxID=1396826 RepID=UPI0021A7BB95|nr:P63C domain-containing protein [Leisingera aquaemixtae]UWQ25876.1 P63C domain-containing protein [Leisingera aquaemixtae]
MSSSPQSDGGKARANKLTKEERSEIARKGAMKRWEKEKKLPKATHGSSDRPLRIGDAEIPCYVLEDGRRVLSLRGMISALGMSGGSSSGGEGDRLVRFTDGKTISQFVSQNLEEKISNPIRFRSPHGGGTITGYDAVLLPELCEVVLEARQAGALQKQQMHIAQQCEALVRSFAKLGIVALVDEATGYQAERDREELHRILEAYLAEERLAWAKRFPDEFYRQIYRLRNWRWPPVGRAKPPVLGHITNDIVYDRLPPGVLNELRRRNPTKEDTKRRQWKHHQFLSEDFGQSDLKDHLLQVVAVMKVSKTWDGFKRNFDEAFPKPGTQIEMSLEDNE